MIEPQIPELADGGYWYVAPVINDPDLGFIPDVPAGTSWARWGDDTDYCVIRSPELVDGLAAADPLTVDSILAASGFSGKPFARAGGM